MTRHATRLFEPETLPAPHGRGPEGWPLVACPTCHNPIPWPPPYASGLCSPRVYYERTAFCSLACKRAWTGPPMTRQAPVDFAAGMPRGKPARPRFAKTLPLWDEVTACAHCGAPPASLRWSSVGFTCYRCGHLTHVQDGAWAHECLAMSGRNV
jgi:hypothetical protein